MTDLTSEFGLALQAYIPASEIQRAGSAHPLYEDYLLFEKIQSSNKSNYIWQELYKYKDKIPSDFISEPPEKIKIIFWLLRGVKEAKKISINSVNIEEIERDIRALESTKLAIKEIIKLNPTNIDSVLLPSPYLLSSGILGAIAGGNLEANDFSKVSLEVYLQQISFALAGTLGIKRRSAKVVRDTVHITKNPASLPPRAFAKYLHAFVNDELGVSLHSTLANITNAIMSPENELARDDIRNWTR